MFSFKNNGQNRKKILDYHEKKLKNPFFDRKKRIISFSGLKNKALIFSLILAIFSLIYLIFFSSFWRIKETEISGLDRMSNEEIQKLINEQMSAKRFFILPQNNLLFFKQEKLIKAFENKYRYQEIKIIKKWPNKLIINIKEKTLAGIWNENGKYYYIDAEGYILSEISPLDIKNNKYPLIANKSSRYIAAGKIQAEEGIISYAAELSRQITAKLPEIIIEHFFIEQELGTLKIKTAEGVNISFNTKENIDKQIDKLAVLIGEKLKGEFKNKKYIDLRFGDKIYYQ